LHDPVFSFEERDETNDDFHSVAKGGIQQAGKSLSERHRHLVGRIAD
jgi:hypothetical protein